MRRHLAALPLAALVATASGCSFVAVRRPPAAPTDAPLECTESRTAPVLDTVGAIATPLIGLMTWGLCAYTNSMQSWASDPNTADCGAVAWTALLGTAAYTGSAVYGHHHVGECRRRAAERAARQPPVRPER